MSKVVVVGSINQDIVVTTDRHPKPGETLTGTGLSYFPGGKGANQAVAAARAGAHTQMVGVVGTDGFGSQLLDHLSEAGVDIQMVQQSNDAPTGIALITVDRQGENSIVVVAGANSDVTWNPGCEISQGNVVMAQFEVPMDTVRAAFIAAKAEGAFTVLNPAPVQPVDRELLALVDVLVVNEHELALLSARLFDESRPDELLKAVLALPVRDDAAVIVTLGASGAVIVEHGGTTVITGRSAQVVDTTGAGDCFVGNLAARLAAGDRLEDAAAYANIAASLSVEVAGAGPSMPTAQQVNAAL